MSLLASLPAPRHGDAAEHDDEKNNSELENEQRALVSQGGEHGGKESNRRRVAEHAPPYGARKGFIPRRLADFDQGGAYPEIHVAQYPLEMGRPDKKRAGGGRGEQTLALTVNAEGEVNYDAIVSRGRKNENSWIATGHKALVPKLEKLNDSFERPDEEEEDQVAKDTASALALKVTKKQAAVNPKNVPTVPGEAQYVKYTPANGGAAKARIIKMQDMPVDPLEPPKFSHIKVPRGSGSPPVPVMHSPPRALSAQDQKDWKIPPCVSNWKNAKGYTIPLDKRLAADGRGLQEVEINDGFAKFSEALYIAEQKARTAVETRAKMQKELMSREKERKEMELRDLAMQARMDRMQGSRGIQEREQGVAVVEESSESYSSGEEEEERRESGRDGGRAYGEDKRRRDEIREERRRERERERRLEAKNAHGYKRSKITRDKDRDISEKIALGMAKVGAGEAMYDQRLFNQETGGAAGMGAEDAYNLYDKPLFTDRSDIYRGKGNAREGDEDDVDTGKFKPSKGFTGVDYSGDKSKASGPVEFEKGAEEADPFGLDEFLTDVRKGRDALDGIGSKGQMIGSSGGGGDYSSSGRKMHFTSGSDKN